MSDYLLSIDIGTINFSYCVLNIKTKKILMWGVTAIANSSKETHERVCIGLAKKLEELQVTKLENYENDPKDYKPSKISKGMTIVVELQPKSNIKTIIIAGQVQMYFVLEKLARDKEDRDFCKIDKIISYHAGNKLKYYVKTEDEEPLPERLDKLKKGHYRNKQVAIEHCRRVLVQQNESQKWIDLFETGKKLDDKADTYLMALAYIESVIDGNSIKYTKAKYNKKMCKGVFLSGKTCRYGAKGKSEYCKIHKDQEKKEKNEKKVKEKEEKVPKKKKAKAKVKKESDKPIKK